MNRSRRAEILGLFGLFGLFMGAIGLWLALTSTDGDGPVELAWDAEACGHCRMHVGDPAFAAQLRTSTGHVVAFDDPGCLARYLEDRDGDAPRGVWFHDHQRDLWHSSEVVGFVPHDHTPMGYGWAAVSADVPGAIGYREFSQAVANRTGGAHAHAH